MCVIISSEKKLKFALNVFKDNFNHVHWFHDAYTIDERYKKTIYRKQITKNE